MADEEFIENDFCVAIAAEIKKEQETLGQASDWPDFKERRGRIKGLKNALEIFMQTLKRVIADDDDDNDMA